MADDMDREAFENERRQEDRERFQKALEGAKRQALYNMFQKEFALRAREGDFSWCGGDHIAGIAASAEYIKAAETHAKNMAKNPGNWLWLTVSPPPDTTIGQLKTAVDNWANSTSVVNAEWAYEQKGDSAQTLGLNHHVHILCSKCKYGVSHHAKEMRRQLERAGLGVCQMKYMAIGDEAADKRRAYIRGEKKADKLAAVAFDPMWRAEHGLLDLYTK